MIFAVLYEFIGVFTHRANILSEFKISLLPKIFSMKGHPRMQISCSASRGVPCPLLSLFHVLLFLQRPRLRNQGTVNKRSTPPYQQLQMVARFGAASAGGGTALPFLLLPLYGRCFPLTCSAHGILPGRCGQQSQCQGPQELVRSHVPSLLFYRVVQDLLFQSTASERRMRRTVLWRYLFPHLLYYKKAKSTNLAYL